MVLLVRFGELALKSRFVRRQLRDRLVGNLQDLFAAEGVECVTEADEARIYVHTDDLDRARGTLSRVFGVVSFSPAEETRAELPAIRDLALAVASGALRAGASFALRTRRVGTHPFTSQDLAREVGAAVRAANPGSRVDLEAPDVEIHIEVRNNRAFVFTEIRPGPGGLPMGSQGRGLAVVDSDAGMVSAWMGMKRGCRVTVAVPAGAGGGFEEPLRRWDVHLKTLALASREGLEDLARLSRAEAVFLGTRFAEFDPAARPKVSVPIFEPVIGLTDAEIAGLAARIRGP